MDRTPAKIAANTICNAFGNDADCQGQLPGSPSDRADSVQRHENPGALTRARDWFLSVPREGLAPGRDKGVDALRGLAILLVVLGHSISNAENLLVATLDNPRYYLSHFLYTFHMPLFMFVAGYVLFGKKIKVRDRAIRLLVPFLAWIPIYWFVDRLVYDYPTLGTRTMTLTGLVDYSRNVLWRPGIGLWFLPTLFLCSLLLVPVMLFEKKGRWWGEATLAAIFLAVNFIPFDYLGAMQVKYFFFFFAAGYLAARYRPELKRLAPGKLSVILVGASAAFIALFGVLYYYGHVKPYAFPVSIVDYFNTKDAIVLFRTPGAYFLRYALACLGIIASIALVRALGQTRAHAALAWFGLVTMDIYVAHMLMLHFAFGNGWIEVLSGFVVAIALSLALSILLLRQWNASALLFLGIKPVASTTVAAPVQGDAGHSEETGISGETRR